MTTQPEPDQGDVEAFLGRVFSDSSRMAVTIMACLGDHLGLFHNLAHGPATSSQLAARAGVNEPSTRAWLRVMASAGYVRYDPTSKQFQLPAEHIPVLAREESPFFVGGTYRWLASLVGHYPRLVRAFQHGGEKELSAADEYTRERMERLVPGTFESLLVQEVLPVLPEVQARLEQGCQVAQIGCGRGRALIMLAQAYPQARFTGYDGLASALEHATRQAQARGVADRVHFQQWDATAGLSETYDVITTFDVIGHAVDPRGLLRILREALRPGGWYLCLELNGADSMEGKSGPFGALFYSLSVLSCLTNSLADEGEWLGTIGLSEAELRNVCLDTGFSRVRCLPIEHPLTSVYEIFP